MTDLFNKVTLPETTPLTPALAFHQGAWFIAWRGDGNENINIMVSDDGTNFYDKFTSETSSDAPSMASTGDRLFIGWKGSGNNNLNVAEVVRWQSSDGSHGLEFDGKITVSDTSPIAPGLMSFNGQLFITWKGDGNDNLNIAQVPI
jgi:hypothetical protein